MRNRRRFDADLVVIGAGSAGLVSAYLGAALQARVVLVEAAQMGGDCLHRGCVPSKALIAAARHAHQARDGARFGIDTGEVRVDFQRVMDHVRGAIARIEPNDSVERYTALGVRCVQGAARFVDPWTVDVDGERIRARNIVIAAGAEPLVPSLPGLSTVDYLTSDSLWQLRSLPGRLAVLGGGAIGCELSQAFARLGARVSLYEMADHLLAGEDVAVGTLLEKRFAAEGIDVHRGARVDSVAPGRLQLATGAAAGFDALLVAAGRKARVDGYGLEELGVEIRNGRIGVNALMQTNYSHIYACGDVAGPWQFTHAAAHQAWHAVANALFRPFKSFRIDDTGMPYAVYTDPEVGRAGLNEAQARDRGVDVETTEFPMEELDRAITEADDAGFARILTVPGKDRIVGATFVGAHAAELATVASLAMRQGIGMNKLLAAIVPYPAWSESVKRVAGRWKQAHSPAFALPWLARYHRLRRGFGRFEKK